MGPLSRRSVILLAYHFPPENSIGAARPGRFVKHLPALGWDPYVITAAHQAEASVHIRAVPDPFLGSRNTVAWQVERLIRRLLFPGHTGIVWAQRASRQAVRWLADGACQPPVVLYSTYPPLGALRGGLELKRRTGLPWIVDYRDPLPYHTLALHPFYRRMQQWIERRSLEAADLAIANTDAVAEIWKQAYPQLANKIEVLWNGFDPEDGIQASPPPPPRVFRRISHVGALYWDRRPDLVLASIERLIRDQRVAPQAVRLTAVGETDRQPFQDPELAARCQSAGWFEFLPKRVSHSEALGICRDSDILLLLQPRPHYQVPAKLYEYVRLGRPILAVVGRGSEAEKILRRSGVTYRCLYPDQAPEEIDDTVQELLAFPPENAAGMSQEFQEGFNAQAQTRQLAGYLERMVKASPGTRR
jgi:hypothetical protein